MSQAISAGLPVVANRFIPGLTPREGNPGGYWELRPDQVGSEACYGHICKVWPIHLNHFDRSRIDRIVLLSRRDRAQHIESMNAQIARECSINVRTSMSAEGALHLCQSRWADWKAAGPLPEVMHVFTEDLSDNLNSIIQFIGA